MKKASHKYFTSTLLLVLIWLWLPGFSQAAASTRSEQIANLLQQARLAMARNHLTVPAEQSAVKYAERILAIDPSHPGAIDILHQVVQRYNSMGLTAVDRAKSLQQQEIQKAQDYRQRAQDIAERHQLDTGATQPLDEQLASVQKSTPALSDEQTSLRTQLAEVAAGYVSLAETALEQGYVQEARRYQIAADVLSNKPYKLSPNAQLAALTERLDRLEAERRSSQLYATNSVAVPSGRTDIFLPPAF